MTLMGPEVGHIRVYRPFYWVSKERKRSKRNRISKQLTLGIRAKIN